MNNFKIGATENVIRIITTYCKGDRKKVKSIIAKLGGIIADMPKKTHESETSDNSILFDNIPLSFIRNWNSKEILIMTNAEALAENKTSEITIYS